MAGFQVSAALNIAFEEVGNDLHITTTGSMSGVDKRDTSRPTDSVLFVRSTAATRLLLITGNFLGEETLGANFLEDPLSASGSSNAFSLTSGILELAPRSLGGLLGFQMRFDNPVGNGNTVVISNYSLTDMGFQNLDTYTMTNLGSASNQTLTLTNLTPIPEPSTLAYSLIIAACSFLHRRRRP
ncbi:MAG: hypothetical protein AAF065_12050 [Verrucomicrobiota bacterium]